MPGGGCDEIFACNYDPNVDYNDGSCIYPPSITGVNDIGLHHTELFESGVFPPGFTSDSDGASYIFYQPASRQCTCDDIKDGNTILDGLISDQGAYCMGGLGPKMCNYTHCAEFESL